MICAPSFAPLSIGRPLSSVSLLRDGLAFSLGTVLRTGDSQCFRCFGHRDIARVAARFEQDGGLTDNHAGLSDLGLFFQPKVICPSHRRMVLDSSQANSCASAKTMSATACRWTSTSLPCSSQRATWAPSVGSWHHATVGLFGRAFWPRHRRPIRSHPTFEHASHETFAGRHSTGQPLVRGAMTRQNGRLTWLETSRLHDARYLLHTLPTTWGE